MAPALRDKLGPRSSRQIGRACARAGRHASDMLRLLCGLLRCVMRRARRNQRDDMSVDQAGVDPSLWFRHCRQGNLRHISRLKFWSVDDILVEKYDWD